MCHVCPPALPQTLPMAGRPSPRHPSAKVGIPGYRGGFPRDARHSPPRARLCSWESLWGAPPPGLTGVGKLVAGSPLAPWRSRRPQEEPSSAPRSPVLRQSSGEAAGGELQGWVCGEGAGGEPHGGVCARGGSCCCSPTIPAVPARSHPRAAWTPCEVTHNWVGQGRGPGVRPRTGSSWSGVVQGCLAIVEGWWRRGRVALLSLQLCWAAGQSGWPLLALHVPGGGSRWDSVCLEHG